MSNLDLETFRRRQQVIFKMRDKDPLPAKTCRCDRPFYATDEESLVRCVVCGKAPKRL